MGPEDWCHPHANPGPRYAGSGLHNHRTLPNRHIFAHVTALHCIDVPTSRWPPPLAPAPRNPPPRPPPTPPPRPAPTLCPARSAAAPPAPASPTPCCAARGGRAPDAAGCRTRRHVPWWSPWGCAGSRRGRGCGRGLGAGPAPAGRCPRSRLACKVPAVWERLVERLVGITGSKGSANARGARLWMCRALRESSQSSCDLAHEHRNARRRSASADPSVGLTPDMASCGSTRCPEVFKFTYSVLN